MNKKELEERLFREASCPLERQLLVVLCHESYADDLIDQYNNVSSTLDARKFASRVWRRYKKHV